MPFESGSITCRLFALNKAMPDNAVERFAEKAAPPIDSSSAGVLQGWVTGRHLLDRNITQETAYFGGHLRLTLLSAERKIPPALLRAECRMEELAQQGANGGTPISRTQRSEIKKSVEERLQPNMPPQLKGIPFVYDEEGSVLYATASSVKDADLLASHLNQRLGFAPIPCTPDALALLRKKIDTRDWKPKSFSPEAGDETIVSLPGREFLTWLWFLSETQPDTAFTFDKKKLVVFVEGPLTFINEGNGAHETVLRKGEPMLSAEAKTALLAGKLLKSAKLTMAIDDQTWQTTIDADEFIFRSLKLPETEGVDAVTRFQQRMVFLGQFREMIFSIYDRYVDERRDASKWNARLKDIHNWVQSRRTRF